jgi:hypothetical protein
VRLPGGTDTPVWPETLTVIAKESLLIIRYGFWIAGTFSVPAADKHPEEITKHSARAF